MDGRRQGRMHWLEVASSYSQESGGTVKVWDSHSRKPPRVQAPCHFLFHQPLPVAFVHVITRSTCLQAPSPSPKQEEREGEMTEGKFQLTFPLFIWETVAFLEVLPYRFLLTFHWPEQGHLGLPQEARVLGEVIVLAFTLPPQETLRFYW